jgi:hypothetical protein
MMCGIGNVKEKLMHLITCGASRTFGFGLLPSMVVIASTVNAMAQSSENSGPQTIIVTATGDHADFGGAQQVGDLPGPDGEVTIREAIIAANNTTGPQTIAFNIPLSDAGFSNGVFQTFVSGPPMTLTDNETTIDGFTQEAFTGNTQPNGGEISFFADIGGGGLSIPGLRINSDNNILRGLVGFNFFQYGIEINGNGNLLEGVLIVQAGSAAVHILGDNNIIDGSNGGQLQNRFSSSGVGVWVRSAGEGNQILGNLIEVNHSDGVDLEGDNNVVGAPSSIDPASRNRIRSNGHSSGEFSPVGSQIDISGDGNIVQGNWLGVDNSGNADSSGSARTGVFIDGSNNVVGGPEPGAGNVISGHGFSNVATRFGVQIAGGVGNIVQGNLIGVGADGVTAIPNEQGVSVDIFFFADVPIDILIADNIIAHSDEDGVRIEGFGDLAPTGITISGNRIFGNGEPPQAPDLVPLGIDLNNDGVTPNDPGDDDQGPNRLQNFPVLANATSDGTTVTITGTLNSVPSETFTIEFFANQACDASGFGEGEFVLGSVKTMTNASGDATFSAPLPLDRAGAAFATATATRDATGDTSEFSACIPIEAAPELLGDVDGNGTVNVDDLIAVINTWGECPTLPQKCPTDISPAPNGDGTVNVDDLLMVINNWG